MDRIILKNLAFYGYHGARAEENQLGQRFYLDITLHTDLKTAGERDNLADTVNYGEVYQCVKLVVENRRYQLLEALAEAVCRQVLTCFEKVEEITVQVRKPGAPVQGIFDFVGVEIRRRRDAESLSGPGQ